MISTEDANGVGDEDRGDDGGVGDPLDSIALDIFQGLWKIGAAQVP